MPGVGQLEIDELYVGIDKRGAQYVFPVQAKGRKDRLGIVQIEQDIAACRSQFPKLICRPIGAFAMEHNSVAMFEFEMQNGDVLIAAERHYKLVPQEQLSEAELQQYASSSES